MIVGSYKRKLLMNYSKLVRMLSPNMKKLLTKFKK
nr:MAG TPA: hypothetical protein [Caudoviricetes sp.]